MHLRVRSLVCSLGFAATVSVATVEKPQHVFSESSQPSTQSRGASITPELSAYVEQLLGIVNLPGLSLAVVHARSGGVPEVELAAWGRSTEDGDGHNLAADNLFGLASVSKAFLASSLGVLMDDYAMGRNVTPLPSGLIRFDWDTKVADILPDDWKLADHWASEKANMRDILSHVSGMPRHDYSYGPDDTTGSMVRRLRYLRPAYELREKWSYNNQMFVVGAHIVSTYSGMAYPAFAEARIFAPLNMTSTTFSPSRAAASGKLTQGWTKFGRCLPFAFTDWTAHTNAGAGGVISSAEDMAKWVGALLNRGVDPATGTIIVPSATFDEMTTAHAITEGAPGDAGHPAFSVAGYGMGWFRQSFRGHEVISHTGAIPGFSTLVALLPADDLGIVILANADEKHRANEALMFRIIEEAAGLEWFDRPALEAELRDKDAESTHPLAEPSTGLSLALSEYTGTYGNQGYGAITLCASTSDSNYCTGVLADFDALAAFGQPRPSESVALYAYEPRIWTSHFRLMHRTGDEFDSLYSSVFPHGYGGNSSAFETWETGDSDGRAEFVVEDGKVRGFALIIDEKAVRSRMKLGGSLQDAADAWFAKVV